MKKGFTLIELLAVIVILAIIALIAVPTITGIVEKTKKGAAGESANGYIDAIDKQMALNLMDSDDTNDLNKGIYDAPLDSKYNLKVKGQTPSSGWVEVTKNGVDRYSLVIGEYVVSYDGINNTVVKGTESNPKPSFATDSWEVIINNVRNGNTDVYNLGDTKEIDMGSFGKHTVRIANMSTPNECSTEGFSETACGFVLEFADIITTHSMNSNSTNVGGWPATSMREYVNSEIFNSLPNELREGIMSTKVISSHGPTSGENNFSSLDKLYLLSLDEIYGRWKYGNYDTASALTRQMDYYLENGVTEDNNSQLAKKDTKINNIWIYEMWTRSSSSNFVDAFQNVYGNNVYAKHEYGVSPAFRIG